MISQYSQPLQSLNQPGITPLPFEEMLKAGQYIQKRYDDSVLATDAQYIDLASTNAIEKNKIDLDNVKAKFQTEMSSLMDKYKGQTYSSDFQRESRKLVSQMATDPTVKLLKENRAQFDIDDARARKHQDDRTAYYDPRLNDMQYHNADGTPTKYTAGVRALKHDEMIDEQGTKLFNAMVQTGSVTKNYDQINLAIKNAIRPDSPIYQDKVAELRQAGDKNAEANAVTYITDRFNTFKKLDRNLGYELELKKYNESKKVDETPGPLGVSGGVWKNPGRPEAREDFRDTLNTLVDRLGKGENIFTNPSAWDDWKSSMGKAASPGWNAGLGDKDFKSTPEGAEAKQFFNSAIKYFGSSATKFKTFKDLLTAYRDGINTQYSSGPSESSKFLSNDKNETMIPFLRGSGLKIHALNDKGFADGDVEDTQKKLAGLKDGDLYFGGIVDFDPTGNSRVSFRLKDNSGAEYAVPLPDDIAQRDFPIVSKLGAAREYTGPVASVNSNMLPKDYWVTKNHNGMPVTYVPIRTFDNSNSPKLRLAVIPGATSEDKYSDIEGAIKRIEDLYKTNPTEASKYLTTPSAAMNAELEDYYTQIQGLNKK